ncbi:MAG: hypothetical protein PHF44_02890 [Candidatus Pacebacteria bacterium]|nr:hypothetical protein [Candidatus Paceibacterota bacterium]
MYFEGYSDQIALCHKERKPTARKDHVCCECSGTIKKGEKYSCVFGVWQDYGSSRPFAEQFKTCFRCEEDWGEILKVFDGNGERDAYRVYGMLREIIQDAFDKGFLTAKDRLANKWLNIWSVEKPDLEQLEREEAVAQMRVHSTPLL